MDDAAASQILQVHEVLPADVRLAIGHISLSTLRAASPSAQVLTILREPTSRLFSHWLFWRQLADDFLAVWGSWADLVRRARRPLARFITDPRLACQTDNLTVRMLLWPHPLIPNDGFIERRHDSQLVSEAMTRLSELSFVDVVENEAMPDNLRNWLGRPLVYERMNETSGMPNDLRCPLDPELSPEVEDLVEERSRLDLVLWTNMVTNRLGGEDPGNLRSRTISTNMDRYRRLMDASPVAPAYVP
jgi:hypothetical protein